TLSVRYPLAAILVKQLHRLQQLSASFRIVYRSGDRTLTEAEVESAHQAVRQQLETQFSVSLRS
ncbi:MAG: hypothetical protein AAGJ55_08350, partial [Cyanobacteria bacterium J06555_12]